ncbi:MAG: hypothetical protein FGM24_00245 [Candidatus Kapabacteria bacterium]|nr:hypothetical protein [Candidatus Kapabacteria bacterium]
MKKHLLRPIISMVCLLAVSACSDKPTVDPKLVDVYTDVVIARESTVDSIQAQSKVRAALVQHGYTQERFEQELRAAGEDPTTFRMLYDSVSTRISAKRKALQGQ